MFLSLLFLYSFVIVICSIKSIRSRNKRIYISQLFSYTVYKQLSGFFIRICKYTVIHFKVYSTCTCQLWVFCLFFLVFVLFFCFVFFFFIIHALSCFYCLLRGKYVNNILSFCLDLIYTSWLKTIYSWATDIDILKK